MIHDLTSDISFLYCEFIMNDVHFDNIYHLGRFVKTVLTYFFFLCQIDLFSITSIVIKHKLPPITLDIGSAKNTPLVPM